MKRRTLLASALLFPVTAQAQSRFLPSAQDQADLARLETYLNGLRSLKARFIQIVPNGQQASGSVWLSRPGRIRFEYSPPTPFLLIAGNGLLVFQDTELKQTTQILLGQTPLGILLADNVKLSGDVTVLGLRREPGMLQVQVTRTSSPGDGSITLVFADNPLALRQWTVMDAQRQETRVTLSNVELGGTFNRKMFEYVDPNLFSTDPSRGN
ncbi:MAG: outer membrane lipoprotein carrier protein LolA [Acetobacteraceae bacterium]|nr:outer membrane lipoprotein carrier protein LolA [Acetobacteraceae bacterium]